VILNTQQQTLYGDIERAAEVISQAEALVIGAGAGIGVDSGLPDFRGDKGFWAAYPVFREAQLSFIDVANPETFERDPRLAWGFYGHRLALYRATVPHAGFDILLKWSERMHKGTRIFTSNVDGQFQKAGFGEGGIHECHGSIHNLQCTQSCGSAIWSAADFVPEVDMEQCRLLNALPVCPKCGALARPNIMMFGDWGWQHDRSREQRVRESQWLADVAEARASIAVIELGAGTAVPSVRSFSHGLVRSHGARIIRINPRECSVASTDDVGVAASAFEALRSIDDLVRPQSARW
jgi:NAD-dependent SIR2 family protein deacetylase